MQLTVETNVRAPIERVWEAYTTPDEIIRWNAASDDWHTTRAIVEECMRCHQWRSLRGRPSSTPKCRFCVFGEAASM